MKLYSRELSDSNDNVYWRVKARDEQASVQAFGRQRDQAEQLAEDLAHAWEQSQGNTNPSNKEN